MGTTTCQSRCPSLFLYDAINVSSVELFASTLSIPGKVADWILQVFHLQLHIQRHHIMTTGSHNPAVLVVSVYPSFVHWQPLFSLAIGVWRVDNVSSQFPCSWPSTHVSFVWPLLAVFASPHVLLALQGRQKWP